MEPQAFLPPSVTSPKRFFCKPHPGRANGQRLPSPSFLQQAAAGVIRPIRQIIPHGTGGG